jgi:hypothetical protein
VIATDVWTSMSQEAEANRRRSALKVLLGGRKASRTGEAGVHRAALPSRASGRRDFRRSDGRSAIRLFRRIAELLGESPGIRPEDVFVNLADAAKENWSVGNGLAQFA